MILLIVSIKSAVLVWYCATIWLLKNNNNYIPLILRPKTVIEKEVGKVGVRYQLQFASDLFKFLLHNIIYQV